MRIEVPPLRARGPDIAALFDHFASGYARAHGRPLEGIDADALEVLGRYAWPGNVRELQNVARRAVLLGNGARLTVGDLPPELVERAGAEEAEADGFFSDRERVVFEFERRYLDDLLRRNRGDTAAAAAEARIPRGTVYRLAKKHGLRPDDYR